MKFSGRVQPRTSNFWGRVLRSAGLQGIALDPKQPVFSKSILSLLCDIPFANHRTGAKNRS